MIWHILRWLEELWGRDRHKRTVQPGKKSVHKEVEGLPTVSTLFSWQSLVWSKPLRVYNREWSCNVSAHDVLTLLSVTCHKSGNMAMPLVVHTKAQRNNRDLWYLIMGRSCARCWNICLCAQYGDKTLSWRSVHKQIYSSKKARQEWLMHSAWDTPQRQPVMRICKKLGVWGQCGNTHMLSHLFALFSPTFHLTALLPLVSDLHTKLFCDYFSVLLQSISLSLSLQSLLRDSQTNHRFSSQQSTVSLPPSLSNSASKPAFLGPQQTEPHWLVTIT